MKIVAIIPAHLASVRFPRKVLHKFFDLPMIEHVRRRAMLSKEIEDVYIATCDEEIANEVKKFGGNVILTNDSHKNGTTRVAEAISRIECTHVILLQGDEPLLIPRHVDLIAQNIKKNPAADAWNATAPIEAPDELDRHSFVKCAISSNNILFCFRRAPFFTEFKKQKKFVRKILGVIAYKKDFLIALSKLPESVIEKYEFIEQMRIIENGYELLSVPVEVSLPSVNEKHEAKIVLDYLGSNKEQQDILNKII